MSDITDLEWKIIDLLFRNASLPLERIARELGVGVEVVQETVSRLHSEGKIKKFSAVIDPEKVGFGETVYVFIESEENYPEIVLQATARAKDWGGVEAFYVTYGDKDAVVRIHIKNKVDLENFMNNALMKVSWYGESETYRLTARIREWGIDYPLNAIPVKALEQLDMRILKELQADCRQRNGLVRLAKKLGTDQRELGTRIDYLEKTRTIRGYTVVLDTRKLGLVRSIMFLNVKRGQYDKVKDSLIKVEDGTLKKNHFYIPFISSAPGPRYADMCLELLSQGLNHLDLLTDALRGTEGVKSSVIYLVAKVLIEDTCVPV